MRHLITKPIALVGMMGSGKSTVGKKLARKLQLQFYDSDKVIEDREGLSISDIYEFRGEEYLRHQEVEVINEILYYGVIVLSTGGSSFAVPELHKLMKENAISIWLKADIEILYERVSRRNTRPQLNCENPKDVLEKMITELTPSYEDADVIIQSGDTELHFVVDIVLNKLHEFLLSKKN